MAPIAPCLGTGQIVVEVRINGAWQMAGGIATLAGRGVGQIEAAIDRDHGRARVQQPFQVGGADQGLMLGLGLGLGLGHIHS